MTFTRQDASLVAGLLLAGLLAGWLSGAYGWSMFAAALVWIALQEREKSRLSRWARRPLSRPESGLKSWQAIASRPFQTITNERRRNRRTIDRFRLMRTITDALPDAAVIVDAHGSIEELNLAALRLLHLDATDKGNHLPSLIRQPEFMALMKRKVEDDLIEFSSPFDDDTRLEARFFEMGENRAMILVRDVTQLNRLLTMRQDFIANVSHELRTPLTVIVGYTETLINEDLDRETTRELIAKLPSPITRMRALVDDLLLLTRLEASPTPTEDEIAPVDMSTLLNAIVSDANVLSHGRHHIVVQKQSNAQILGIEAELHSACLNLVTNAVRYSPDGGTITVRWEAVDNGARFSVTDEGIGIPKEHLSRLTERFYRVELAKSRVRGGTGLGLAIVKHVLKRHNTRLQVDSELGRGSTFYCVFPSSQLKT